MLDRSAWWEYEKNVFKTRGYTEKPGSPARWMERKQTEQYKRSQ